MSLQPPLVVPPAASPRGPTGAEEVVQPERTRGGARFISTKSELSARAVTGGRWAEEGEEGEDGLRIACPGSSAILADPGT